MSSKSDRTTLIEAIGKLVMRWQDATEAYDETVGETFGLNGAERRCLSLIWQAPQTASAIARGTRLTPAAVTALVDRLEKRGYVRREPDPDDRRKVLVVPGEEAMKLTEIAYLPMARAGADLMAQYSDAELKAIRRFAEEATAIQEQMAERLLAERKKR